MTAKEWIPILISLMAALVGLAVFLDNRRQKREKVVADNATLHAKVDMLLQGSDEIKGQNRELRCDVNTALTEQRKILESHGERLAAVESSAKSAHHRLDWHDKLHDIHTKGEEKDEQ